MSTEPTTEVKMYNKVKQEPEVCGICLERLTYNRRNIHETICGHKFHACCFRNIPEAKCPYCRRIVDHEPVRKIRLLKADLNAIRYEENYSALHQINELDLQICEDRIQHLRDLLTNEIENRTKIKSVIRNTNLYYKYKKQEIKNRIKCVQVDMHLNCVIKKHIKEERRKEREERKQNKQSSVSIDDSIV